MKSIIFILSILCWEHAEATSQICGKPKVRRAIMHIYRTPDVDVTVYHCYYTGQHTYSDITKECINAFNTGIYIDKWDDKNYVKAKNSPLKLAKYTTKANTMQNEILLKSGTVCRYDRGFCYDPQESPNNFAVVWEVSHEKPDLNAADLIEIFYGWVDIWELRDNSLKYLVFQDNRKDRSFALQLIEQGELNNVDFWYTDRYGMLVSQESLKRNVRPIPNLNQNYFPLKPKQFISEKILRSCDFQNFPFDFDQATYQNYILESNNLLAILGIFQKQIIETKKTLSGVSNGNTKNSVNNRAINTLEKEIRDTKTSLLTKDQEIAEIRNTIKNMIKSSSTKLSDISNAQEKIKQILRHQQGSDAELGNIKDKLVVLQNQLLDESKEKKISKEVESLDKKFTLLETTFLEKNKEISKIFNTEDKLIKDISKDLRALYIEQKNKDIKLKKEQDDISNRLINVELNLNKQNDDIKKCENYTKFILMQEENDKNARDKLELTYNGILDRLILHDIEISKCQNHTTVSLSNKNYLLKVIEENIGKTEDMVKQLERQIKELQNKDIVIEKYLHNADGITTKLKDDIAKDRQELIGALKNNANEIKTIKEKGEQCRKAIDDIINSKDNDSEKLQRNLTEVRHILSKQDGNISKLQGILKEIYDKLDANDKGFTAAISDCKHYVNTRLQSKGEEITQINNNLTTKDREIKILYEHVRKIDEKNKGLEIKINEKDEEIKRLQNTLMTKDQEFRAEVDKRDQEYERLENEINEIKISLQTVPAV